MRAFRLWALAACLFGAAPALAAWHSVLQVAIVAAGGYQGPGDIVSGAKAWYGLRGYNAAYSGNAVNVCLPADSVCADVTISAGNLVVPGGLSTCNNSTVICTIKTWYDQSGANACSAAPCNVTQATIAQRATLVVPGAANGCPNTAKYCAAFSGSQGYLPNLLLTGIAAAPFSIAAVSIRTSGTGYSTVFAFSSTSGALYHGNGANKVDFFTTADNLGTATDSVWRGLQMIVNGASSSGQVDGASAVTFTYSGGANNIWGIGQDGAGSDFLIGKINEVGIWPSAFSAGNITSINTQQHSYWGF